MATGPGLIMGAATNTPPQRGQLPKAYLRVDPNSDTHPDPGAMLLLMIWANRQPQRGRFKSLDTLRMVLGSKRLQACVTRGDLVETEGRYILDGWDEWQEGDQTVGERVRRIRELRTVKRYSAVTEPFRSRKPASEALGVKAVPSVPTTPPIPPAAAGGDGQQSSHGADSRGTHGVIPRGAALEDLVDAAALYVRERWEAGDAQHRPALRDVRRRFREWFRAGIDFEVVKTKIDRGEHVPRPKL